MNGEIKFGPEHYETVRLYLNNKEDLRRVPGFGGDGQIYKSGGTRVSGIKLQKCPKTGQVIISELNGYHAFDKVKNDLEKLTKKGGIETK